MLQADTAKSTKPRDLIKRQIKQVVTRQEVSANTYTGVIRALVLQTNLLTSGASRAERCLTAAMELQPGRKAVDLFCSEQSVRRSRNTLRSRQSTQPVRPRTHTESQQRRPKQWA